MSRHALDRDTDSLPGAKPTFTELGGNGSVSPTLATAAVPEPAAVRAALNLEQNNLTEHERATTYGKSRTYDSI
jgi:hypothetical protein